MRSRIKNKRIFAVVLAAGASSRFGAVKQLARIGNETLIQRAATVATNGCGERVLIIAGAAWQDVMKSAASRCSFYAINENYKEGIGGSIALASRILSARADAMLLLLADQVQVTAEHLRDLMAAWSGDDNEIVASAYAQTKGPPILLPRDTFASLAELTGDNGARALLGDARFSLVKIPCEAAAVDIDRPDDLRPFN